MFINRLITKNKKFVALILWNVQSADPSLLILVNHSQSQKFPSFKNFPCSVFTQKSLSRIFSGRASVQVKPKLNMIQKTSRTLFIYKFVELKSSSNASSMLLSSKSSTFAIDGKVLLLANECRAGMGAGPDTGLEYMEIFLVMDEFCDEITGRGYTEVVGDLIDKLSALLGPK